LKAFFILQPIFLLPRISSFSISFSSKSNSRKTKAALKYFEAVTPDEKQTVRHLARTTAKLPKWAKQQLARLPLFKVIVGRSLLDSVRQEREASRGIPSEALLSAGALHTHDDETNQHHIFMAKEQPMRTIEFVQSNDRKRPRYFSKKALQCAYLEEVAHTLDDSKMVKKGDRTYSQTPEFEAAYQQDLEQIRQRLLSKPLNNSEFAQALMLQQAMGENEVNQLISNNGRKALMMLAYRAPDQNQIRRECFAKTAVSVLLPRRSAKPLYVKTRAGLLLQKITHDSMKNNPVDFNNWVNCERATYQHYFPNVRKYIENLVKS
jgi:hypothetical protein